MEPGIFYISDLLSRLVCPYIAHCCYGPDYAMVGKFELNDDNTITPLESYVAGWGDSMDQMTNTVIRSCDWDSEMDCCLCRSAIF
ncbi:DUF5012 domain-containing protein [Bacteroides faecis]|nr:DUF5012 domain-containing protein [Bacteroides faecis]